MKIHDDTGKFVPGNPGRPKGSKNRKTLKLRDKINSFLNDKYEEVEEEFSQLSAKEKIDFYLKLLEYGLPKLSRTEVQEVSSIEELLMLSPEERQAKIIELKKRIDERRKSGTYGA
jgi:hypothetical protein